MGFTNPINNKQFINQYAIKETTQLQPKGSLKEQERWLARRKIIKSNNNLKLRNNRIQPLHMSYCEKVCKKQMIAMSLPVITSNIMNNIYSYQQDYNYPITMNDWHPMHTPLFTVPCVPVILQTPGPMFAANLSPLIGTVVQPILSPILAQTYLQENTSFSSIISYSSLQEDITLSPIIQPFFQEGVPITTSYIGDTQHSFEQIKEDTKDQTQIYYTQEIESQKNSTIITELDEKHTELQENVDHPIEYYLKLPKELFPSPDMLAIDPNPIIDEFCKMSDLQRHVPWILDLEFGIPRTPITRLIPMYSVIFNSIRCKNSPDAIHPGFESCDPDFKKVLLFYYNCIVSSWYKGYMIMYGDRSVDHFQSWLLPPMQVLGFCWS